MHSYGNIVFRGRSGEPYRFQAWPLETRFKSMPAVYIITRRACKDRNYPTSASHECLMVGTTEDLGQLATRRYGTPSTGEANCICVQIVQDPERRTAIERDLLDSSLIPMAPRGVY